MASPFAPVNPMEIPPPDAPDFTRRLRSAISRLGMFGEETDAALNRISLGQTPDGSGNPLPTLEGPYFLLGGRPANQLGYGGTAAYGTLTLGSTSSGTKGFIYLGSPDNILTVDETQDFVGINTDPSATLHIVGSATGGATTLTPSSTISCDWGVYTGVGGTTSLPWDDANRLAAIQSNDDNTLYLGQADNGQGTNPAKFALNGVIPATVTSVTVNVRQRWLSAPGAGVSAWTMRIVRADGQYFETTHADFHSDNDTTSWVTTPFVIDTSGAGTTGGTPNSIELTSPNLNGIYCLFTYVEATFITPGGLVRWDLSSGARSGQIDNSGFLGVGTGSDTLSAMLTAEADASTTVISKLIGATSQTADHLQLLTSAAAGIGLSTAADVFRMNRLSTGLGLSISVASIATSTKTWTAGNYSGIPAVPTDQGTNGQLLTAVTSGQPVWNSTSGLTLSVTDSLFSILDNLDPTKIAMFQVSGITTGTTRTFTFPDADDTFAVLGTPQTFTRTKTFESTNGTAEPSAVFKGNVNNGVDEGTLEIYDELGTLVGRASRAVTGTFEWNFAENIHIWPSGIDFQPSATFSFALLTGSVTRTYSFPDISGLILTRFAAVNVTNRSTSIGSTGLLASTQAVGAYQINIYMRCSTAGDAGDNVTASINWTDTNSITRVFATLDLSAVDNVAFATFIVFKSSTAAAVNYLTTLTSPGAGTPAHSLRIRVTFMGNA